MSGSFEVDGFRARMQMLQDRAGSPTEFAAVLGVRLSTASSWVRYAVPRLDGATLIAERTGVTLDWLAGLSEEGGPAAGADPDSPPTHPRGSAAEEARLAAAQRRRRREEGGQP